MLTTPVVKDEDTVFPGENWFFYWKTSASLWKSKIEQTSLTDKIIVPINWSFHTDTGDKIDFAKQKPETDFKRLYDICKELDKEIIFLLPVSPVPYLPNGGIPYLLARTASCDQYGLNRASADSDGTIHNFYSFYDPRVYKGFTRFCSELNSYFQESGIKAPLWGANCGHYSHGHFNSYIFDRSVAFQSGFSRFVEMKKGELKLEKITAEQEHEFIIEYNETISRIYIDIVKHSMEKNWQGVKNFSFLEGSMNSIENRMLDQVSDTKIIDDALKSLDNGILPSSILLPNRNKNGIYSDLKKQVINSSRLDEFYNDKTIIADNDYIFKTSNAVNIFHNVKDFKSKELIAFSGFIDFCKNQFSWNYSYSDINEFHWEDYVESPFQFFYFNGKEINAELLGKVLKLFMSGGKVLIDIAYLEKNLRRRLESFYLENELSVEKIRFITEINTVTMGEGRLLIFNSNDFQECSDDELNTFWNKVTKSIGYIGCDISQSGEVRYKWQERAIASSDLKYDKVKRISFFNPSSYKQKLNIKYPSEYVFQKMIDQNHVEINNTPHEIELSFMPKGSISLDFGIISE
ncbi:hypothetical protein [Halobacteriovorax sp. ZH4_bin.1]|uniref:hypothetical protein n=1 Tax=unclassified Halobacteriovorax TaxID=2639665 RepID=UPI00371128F1